ncbi:hypothetical protein IFM89_018747 [Coptis chinensis]|uniref:Uncharacterized protein n=1 Tax=Coptis chinensis TaxID=261450 RepID=A0A835HKT0_9MAGN|nr:hypothetical protein IFM89_018747 [Coptis chinensis]
MIDLAMHALVTLLEKYHKSQKNRVLVFVLYKKEANSLKICSKRGVGRSFYVHGDKAQRGSYQCTLTIQGWDLPFNGLLLDVAAFGIGYSPMWKWLSTTFPSYGREDYAAGIGRTGRAGKERCCTHLLHARKQRAFFGSRVNVSREAGRLVPTDLMKFGTHVKKKESKLYGAHFKEISADAPKSKKITFNDSMVKIRCPQSL